MPIPCSRQGEVSRICRHIGEEDFEELVALVNWRRTVVAIRRVESAGDLSPRGYPYDRLLSGLI